MRLTLSLAVCACVLLAAAPSWAQGPYGPPGPPTPPGTWPARPAPGPYPSQPGAYPQQQPYPQYPQQQYPQQQYPQQQYPQQQYPQHGQYPSQMPAPTTEPRGFESSLGFKLLLGGNLWTTPDNVDPGYDALGFAGSGGGFGWGVAAYYEARIAQYLGLELDFGYDHSVLQRDLTYKVNDVPFKVNEKVSASRTRWGLLVKGILPVSWGRVWLGLGPELVSAGSVDGTVEVTEGNPNEQLRKGIESSITAKKKRSTLLLMGFGLSIDLGEQLEIPVELRAARNLTQPSDWKDRVDTTHLYDTKPRYEVTVQNSWDFRLVTGLGYRF